MRPSDLGKRGMTDKSLTKVGINEVPKKYSGRKNVTELFRRAVSNSGTRLSFWDMPSSGSELNLICVWIV